MNSDERGDVREFTQVRWPADKHTTFSIALQVYTNNINKNAGKKGSSTEKRDAHFYTALSLLPGTGRTWEEHSSPLRLQFYVRAYSAPVPFSQSVGRVYLTQLLPVVHLRCPFDFMTSEKREKYYEVMRGRGR